jgi:hypothetical protein
VRNKEKQEIALVNIERNPVIMIISVVVTVATAFETYQLFKAMNPWGFAILTPAAVIAFQTLWLILNPFALVFKDKIEIKQSFFHSKDRYFIDIKHIARNKKGKIYITYHDDEIERINLFGIKNSHVELLKAEVEKHIVTSAQQA